MKEEDEEEEESSKDFQVLIRHLPGLWLELSKEPTLDVIFHSNFLFSIYIFKE